MKTVSHIAKIGIITSTDIDPSNCINLIRRSGGLPVAIPLCHLEESFRDPNCVQGFVILGEEESNEVTENNQTFPGASETRKLWDYILKSNLPILCIGSPLYDLNLALGGRNPRIVPNHGKSLDNCTETSSYHRIFISPGSKLADVVGSGGFVRVNSRHYIGLKEADKSRLLATSAYSLEDGVIEAVETTNDRWIIGVQFHPERQKELPPHFGRLFEALVKHAENTTG